jgi:SAM-dependent methyltransferase
LETQELVEPSLQQVAYERCPLCDSAEMTEIARGDCSHHETYREGIPRVLVWKRCTECGHVFRDGYFSQSALRTVFEKTMLMQTVGVEYEQVRLGMEATIDLVLPYANEGIWLDVGFGDGALLRTVKEFGFSPVGIELRENNVEALRKLGVPAYRLDIGEVAAEPPCGVLSLQYVLAHLPFPRLALASAWRLLAENGVLLISTPNLESSLWEELDSRGANPYWNEVECYHHFGKTRLYVLLREHGFRPVRYALGHRYRSCMEVVALKLPVSTDLPGVSEREGR